MSANESASVLVVLDGRGERARVCRYLVERGCAVTKAGDGVAGLKAIKRAAFDVVVSDVQLRPRDGLWLWREAIAARPELRGRFLFCTAAPLVELLAGPGEAFLLKPFDVTQLWTRVTALRNVQGRLGATGQRRGTRAATRAATRWRAGAPRR